MGVQVLCLGELNSILAVEGFCKKEYKNKQPLLSKKEAKEIK
jgi:hypothetical protein